MQLLVEASHRWVPAVHSHIHALNHLAQILVRKFDAFPAKTYLLVQRQIVDDPLDLVLLRLLHHVAPHEEAESSLIDEFVVDLKVLPHHLSELAWQLREVALEVEILTKVA